MLVCSFTSRILQLYRGYLFIFETASDQLTQASKFKY